MIFLSMILSQNKIFLARASIFQSIILMRYVKRKPFGLYHCAGMAFFMEPIVKNHQRYLDNGGHFLIPLPELKVIGLSEAKVEK